MYTLAMMIEHKKKKRIISFRLPTGEANKLNELMGKPIEGIKSEGQLVRKLVLDFVSGRIQYANPADAQRNPELS
jgi:hypothetical protein